MCQATPDSDFSRPLKSYMSLQEWRQKRGRLPYQDLKYGDRPLLSHHICLPVLGSYATSTGTT